MAASSCSTAVSTSFSRYSAACVGQVGRNVGLLELGAQRLVLPDDRLHAATRSTTPDEVALAADRQLQHQRDRAQPVFDHVDAAEKVGADAVHLVDEADARNLVLVGLAPHRLGLRLDAGDRVEHGDRAVEHAQASARPRW